MLKDPVSRELKMTFKDLPITIRELSRRSGVNVSTLVQARDGKVRLTPDATKKVVRALREMSKLMAKKADKLEKAAKKRGDR